MFQRVRFRELFSMLYFFKLGPYNPRVGICPCRQCRRQCKIFASSVNFSIFTHFLCFFLLKLLKLGKTSIEKKHFLSGIARIMGGGVYPCPNFLALFLEVHFWSIKRVYFFKNANVLNF